MEDILTVIEIIDAFTFYGLDVMALAAATCLSVQLLKVTVFKKRSKKVLTFLPFFTGTLLYAAYFALRNLSLECLVAEYVTVIEHGFSVGALSTLIYVWYEQFVRTKKETSATESVIATLIKGYVPDEVTAKVANEIALAVARDVTGNGAKRIAEILQENRAEGESLDEREMTMLSRLIIDTLASLTVNLPEGK